MGRSTHLRPVERTTSSRMPRSCFETCSHTWPTWTSGIPSLAALAGFQPIRSRWPAAVASDGIEQLRHVEWLAKEIGRVDLARPLRRILRRGEHDHRGVGDRQLAVGAGELPAVHDGHAHVQEYGG